ncbi:MAG: hypothetical protein NZU63_15060, partial [Gemmataceae bacterium]|nr:hypothetical protein [Gemmataceae bacterium]MDW8244912.1 hypothetical protein [Thermogemmata sp.]
GSWGEAEAQTEAVAPTTRGWCTAIFYNRFTTIFGVYNHFPGSRRRRRRRGRGRCRGVGRQRLRGVGGVGYTGGARRAPRRPDGPLAQWQSS